MSEITIEQKILYDELSDVHAKHIADMPYLEDWIIDAMKTYAEYRINLANGIDTSTSGLHLQNVTNRTLNEKKPICYRCLLCGRDKFTRKSPHNCTGGFRKRNIKWEPIFE